MPKATKKTPAKRKPRKTPLAPELWVLNPSTGEVDKTFVKGYSCVDFECNTNDASLWFKVQFEGFSITTAGIPYSIIEPLK